MTQLISSNSRLTGHCKFKSFSYWLYVIQWDFIPGNRCHFIKNTKISHENKWREHTMKVYATIRYILTNTIIMLTFLSGYFLHELDWLSLLKIPLLCVRMCASESIWLGVAVSMAISSSVNFCCWVYTDLLLALTSLEVDVGLGVSQF